MEFKLAVIFLGLVLVTMITSVVQASRGSEGTGGRGREWGRAKKHLTEDSVDLDLLVPEVEDMGSGSGSGSGGGDGGSTTESPPPTTTLYPQILPDIAGETYHLKLPLKFNSSCGETGTCDETLVKETLVPVFATQTAAFGFQGITVLGFRNSSFSGNPSVTGYSSSGTVVTYTADYSLGAALENRASLIQVINGSVFRTLGNEIIGNHSIDGDYLYNEAQGDLAQAADDLDLYASDLCAFVLVTPDSAVCPFGHVCVSGQNNNTEGALHGATCQNRCEQHVLTCDEEYGVCLINGEGEAECSCEDHTLQISSTNCFHQNYLIFICAVGGGILIIAVTVLLSVLLCKDSEKESEDRLSGKDILLHDRFEGDEGRSFTGAASRSTPRLPRSDSRGSASSSPGPPSRRPGDTSTPSSFFSGRENGWPPRHQDYTEHHNQAFDWDETDQIQARDLDLPMDRRGRRDQAPNSRDRQPNSRRDQEPDSRDGSRGREPESGTRTPDTPDRDYDDPYYRDVLQSDSLRGFQPKLDHIDHNKVYAFRRPVFASDSLERSVKNP